MNLIIKAATTLVLAAALTAPALAYVNGAPLNNCANETTYETCTASFEYYSDNLEAGRYTTHDDKCTAMLFTGESLGLLSFLEENQGDKAESLALAKTTLRLVIQGCPNQANDAAQFLVTLP